MDQPYFTGAEKKTAFFYIALILMLLGAALSINTDLAEFSQHTDLSIPKWFFWIIFSIDTLMIACMAAIYFYRKIGVILLPLLIMAHFLLHNFYLSTMLYSDLNFLFLYFAAGLLAVIPRWNYFK